MPLKLTLIFALAIPLFADPAVRYTLSFPNAVHHQAEVRVDLSGAGSRPLKLFMSRSSPGRYALHEFAKNVFNLRAFDEAGSALPMVHDTPDSWIVTPSGGEMTWSYTLFGDRVDGTYSAIDATHAHLNMPATLMWAQGFENANITVDFDLPPGSGWKAATQLVPLPNGAYTVPAIAGMSKLEWLMDSPVELSAFTLREWQMDGTTFRLALHHEGTEAEASAFQEMCRKVVAEEKRVFGEFPKYDNGTYTFIVDFLPWTNYDGMEHRDSTVISAPLTLKDAAARAIGIASHEFFHSWNVRRIRPKSLQPFDFERVDMSGELWFAEGFTSYYGELALRRANLSSFDTFLGSMSQAVSSVLTQPGRRVRSAVGMSEQAPFVDAATSIDPTDQANTYISYYTYGDALAFGIDLAIRARFPGKSLDSWMQTMWREHSDVSRPYTLDDLEQALAETVGDTAFAGRIFEDNIRGRQPLDYANLVKVAGLTLSLAHPGKVWLGIERPNPLTDGLELTRPTLDGSPSYLAGLDRGDEILECAHAPTMDMSKLEACLASHKPGDSLTLRVKSRAGVQDVTVDLAQDPALTLIPAERSTGSTTPAIADFRNQWISDSWHTAK